MKLTKKNIDDYLYEGYESLVVYLKNEYFGEELTMICEDNLEEYIVYKFLNCYKVDISHSIGYPKDKMYKDQSMMELSCYLVNWNIEIEEELYKIKITAHPLYLEIWCKDIKTYRIKKDEYDYPNFDNV